MSTRHWAHDSLRYKFLLPLLVLAVVLGVVASAVIYSYFKHNLLAQIESRAADIAQAVNLAVESTSRRTDLQRFVAALGANRDIVGITVVTGEPSIVLVATNPVWTGRPLALLDMGTEDKASLQRALTDSNARFEGDAEGGHARYVLPLLVNTPSELRPSLDRGAVLVEMRTEAIGRTLMFSAWMVITLVAASLGICVALIYLLLDRLVLAPAETISATMRRRAAGDASAYTRLKPKDEIGELGRQLDTMVDVLAEQELRFRSLIESTSDIVSVYGPDGMIKYVSPAVKAVGGYEPSELIGTNFLSFVHPDDLERAGHIVADLLQHPEKVHTAELRYRHKNGSWLTLESVNRNYIAVPAIGGIVGSLRDITERRRMDKALVDSESYLHALVDNVSDVIVVTEMDGTIRFANESLQRSSGYVLHEITDHSFLQFLHPEDMARAMEQMRRNLVDPTATVRGEYRIRHKDGSYLEFEVETRNLLDVPAVHGLVGIMRDITERKRQQHRLDQSLESTIAAIAATVETRDPYTAGHQRRVAHLSAAIATELGLHADSIRGIRLAAAVHDVGKIYIPAEILSKPAKLTELEYSLVKAHSKAGYDILKDVDFPWPIAEMVHQHHEQPDGSGYPRGLKGDEILLEARIIAVADTVEAMSSHRPYRPTFGSEAAIEEIIRKRGSSYDARVVDACVRLFREKGYQLPDLSDPAGTGRAA